MKILLSSDYHIIEKDFIELDLVLAEIASIMKKEEISEHYILGDVFDKVNPNPKELDLFSTFLKTTKIPTTIVIAKSHESIAEDNSVLNHFGLLSETTKLFYDQTVVIPENYKMLLGHFTVKESFCGFKSALSIEELRGYRKIFLGHQHTMQTIVENTAYHIGSIRFINHDESKNPYKYVGVLDLEPHARDFSLKKLTTPFPMIDVYYGDKTEINQHVRPSIKSEQQLVTYLTSLDKNTKVKIVIDDFEHFRSFLKIATAFRAKFFQFKEEKKFETVIDLHPVKTHELPDFKEAVARFLAIQVIDPEVKKALLEELK